MLVKRLQQRRHDCNNEHTRTTILGGNVYPTVNVMLSPQRKKMLDKNAVPKKRWGNIQ